ncbi:TM2 domain-containing protein [Limnohabitans sp.]|uniref:TM2 domain-containing protein n=1 Tax=Limnohabitans sp. TaxID=1907725 RepID=UPI0038620ADC
MKSKTTAGLLALFLGGLGMHKFYLGKWVQGLIYLVFCWTFVPAVIAFFEAIFLFIKSDAEFQAAYGDSSYIMTPSGLVHATADSHVKCPDCRELVIKDARKCRHCGCVLIPQ